MSSIASYPKIFHIGGRNISALFHDEVEITEKLDGSMFAFGRMDGELVARSKRQQLVLDAPPQQFIQAIAKIQAIEHLIPDNTVFYGEYIQQRRHNLLTYSRIPKGTIALFGGANVTKTLDVWHRNNWMTHDELTTWAEHLGVDVVRRVFLGKIDSIEELKDYLTFESALGGVEAEGVVVKNYFRQGEYAGQELPFLVGKYVRESFKEVNRTKWAKAHTFNGRVEEFIESFRSEARWHKAVQHLRENDQLTDSPKDIGMLIKEVHQDIETEEKDYIINTLWDLCRKEIARKSTAGFPEWYKEQLAAKSFDKPEETTE